MKSLIVCLVLGYCFFSYGDLVCQAQDRSADLSHFPKEESPRVIGNRVAGLFIGRLNSNADKKNVKPHFITYPTVCTWYGGLTFAKASGNKKMQKQLIEAFDPFFTTKASFVHKPDHVDFTVFGTVPLEIYRLTQKKKYLDMGLSFADAQWGTPQGPHVTPASLEFYKQGLTWQTRLWIDDMFMITSVETQAYLATGDVKYINRAAKEMVVYLDSLQRPNGLFYHAPDVPFYWGRGNGWVAVGMTELLQSLPDNSPYRPRIMESYKKMMAALLHYQTPDGVWRQLIVDQDSWPETSSTGMFTFAFITGVKKGWLPDDVYGPAARKAWIGLVSFLNAKGEMTSVCEGTNKKNDRQYYLDRKRNTGDLHGQAPVLWCATALLQ